MPILPTGQADPSKVLVANSTLSRLDSTLWGLSVKVDAISSKINEDTPPSDVAEAINPGGLPFRPWAVVVVLLLILLSYLVGIREGETIVYRSGCKIVKTYSIKPTVEEVICGN